MIGVKANFPKTEPEARPQLDLEAPYQLAAAFLTSAMLLICVYAACAGIAVHVKTPSMSS